MIRFTLRRPLATYTVLLLPILCVGEVSGITKGTYGLTGFLHATKPLWAWAYFIPAYMLDSMHLGMSAAGSLTILLICAISLALAADVFRRAIKHWLSDAQPEGFGHGADRKMGSRTSGCTRTR